MFLVTLLAVLFYRGHEKDGTGLEAAAIADVPVDR
jgi:hypothetical protein